MPCLYDIFKFILLTWFLFIIKLNRFSVNRSASATYHKNQIMITALIQWHRMILVTTASFWRRISHVERYTHVRIVFYVVNYFHVYTPKSLFQCRLQLEQTLCVKFKHIPYPIVHMSALATHFLYNIHSTAASARSGSLPVRISHMWHSFSRLQSMYPLQ